MSVNCLFFLVFMLDGMAHNVHVVGKHFEGRNWRETFFFCLLLCSVIVSPQVLQGVGLVRCVMYVESNGQHEKDCKKTGKMK